MKIPLIVYDNMYMHDTVSSWKEVWKMICQMAYEGNEIYKVILVYPSLMETNEFINGDFDEGSHSRYYQKRIPKNDEEITLDYMWKQYSRKYKDMQTLNIIPEFEQLHVPRPLFESLGIRKWFEYSFPNCRITYWEE